MLCVSIAALKDVPKPSGVSSRGRAQCRQLVQSPLQFSWVSSMSGTGNFRGCSLTQLDQGSRGTSLSLSLYEVSVWSFRVTSLLRCWCRPQRCMPQEGGQRETVPPSETRPQTPHNGTPPSSRQPQTPTHFQEKGNYFSPAFDGEIGSFYRNTYN